MNRTTLGLIGAFVVVFAFVWWTELRGGRSERLPVSPSGPAALFNVNADQVRQLVIVKKDRRLELARTDSGWRIAVPDLGAADSGRTDLLVRTLAALVPNRELSGTGERLDVYGLEPAAITIDLVLEKETKRLLIGSQTVDKNGYFARLDPGRVVYVIPASAVDQQVVMALEHPPTPTPTPAASPSSSP